MPDTLTLTAPLSGVIYPLERVPDPVFAQKLVGDGVSIDPTDACLRAPCAGEVMHLHAAGHAVTLRAAGGVKVFMHIGIDTVAQQRLADAIAKARGQLEAWRFMDCRLSAETAAALTARAPSAF